MISHSIRQLPILYKGQDPEIFLSASATCDECGHKQDFEGKVKPQPNMGAFVTGVYVSNGWFLPPGTIDIICGNCKHNVSAA